MTTQYKYLSKEEILQEGDEFNSCIDGWVPSRNVGRKSLSDSSYRRPIPAETKQYREVGVGVGEVLQGGDEFLAWLGGYNFDRRDGGVAAYCAVALALSLFAIPLIMYHEDL